MSALLDDVLDFSRMRSRSQLKYTKVNLNNVVHDVLEELSELIKESEAVVAIKSLPTINGNPVQIYHLFENLISTQSNSVQRIVAIRSRFMLKC